MKIHERKMHPEILHVPLVKCDLCGIEQTKEQMELHMQRSHTARKGCLEIVCKRTFVRLYGATLEKQNIKIGGGQPMEGFAGNMFCGWFNASVVESPYNGTCEKPFFNVSNWQMHNDVIHKISKTDNMYRQNIESFESLKLQDQAVVVVDGHQND